jgi:hypothetical protein
MQTALIKSLTAQVAALSGNGRGRRSAVVQLPGNGEVVDQTQPKVNGQELLAKSLTAQAAGRMTGLEVATLESYLTRGLQAPADLVAKVHG